MFHYSDVVLRGSTAVPTAPVPNALVTLYERGSQTIVPIFRDQFAAQPIGNPVTTGVDGSFDFYVQAGRYDLSVLAPSAAAVVRSDIEMAGIGGLFESVRLHGAKGNGTHDDTAAILETIAVVAAFGGGVVYFPPGIYLCNTYASYRGTLLAFVVPAGVTLAGAGPSSIITSTVTPAGIGYGFIGLGTIAGFEYDGNSIPTYAINTAATRETLSVTLTTAANASHFAAGDDVICIGVAGALGLGTRDLNIVVASNASTGKVDLLYPITKDYSAGSPTIANVTAYTARNIEVRDLQIISAHQTFCGAQIKGLAFRRLVLSGQPGFVYNHFQLNYIRDLRIHDNRMRWESALASDGVGAGRSSADIWITDNRIRSNFGGISLGEGAAHCHVTGNHLDVHDAFGDSAIGIGGAYMVDISGDNHVHFTTAFASVPAIYDANGAVSEKVKIVGNTIITRGTGLGAVKAESPGTKLEGNIIETSTRGVWAVGRKLSIKHNDITLTAGNEYGVLVEYSEHSQDIIGNTITNLGPVTGSGVRILDAGNQTKCNIVTHNRIEGFTEAVTVINPDHESTIVNEKNQ